MHRSHRVHYITPTCPQSSRRLITRFGLEWRKAGETAPAGQTSKLGVRHNFRGATGPVGTVPEVPRAPAAPQGARRHVNKANPRGVVRPTTVTGLLHVGADRTSTRDHAPSEPWSRPCPPPHDGPPRTTVISLRGALASPLLPECDAGPTLAGWTVAAIGGPVAAGAPSAGKPLGMDGPIAAPATTTAPTRGEAWAAVPEGEPARHPQSQSHAYPRGLSGWTHASPLH